MKRILLFTITSILLLACEAPKKKEKKEVQLEEKTEKPTIIEEVKEVNEIKEVDNTLISLKKQPCSGDCPVFEVSISKDSILSYNGIQYTTVTGEQKIKLSDQQYSKLTELLNNVNFQELDSTYTQSGTEDFAKTIISAQEKNITVRLWKDAPENLTNLYVYIEDILYDNKYLE